jgi:hypothetical protein
MPLGGSPVDDRRQLSPEVAADLRVSSFIHGTGQHPCPWCGGETRGWRAPPARYIIDESPDQLIVLDQPLWGRGIVELRIDGGWMPLAQLERRCWMTSADVEAIRRHTGTTPEVTEGWVSSRPSTNRRERRRAARHRR